MRGNSSDASEQQQLSSTFLVGLIVLKCFFCICGVLGNVGVIVYNICLNHDKTPSSYFVVNLAVADLLTCLTVHPLSIVKYIRVVMAVEYDQTLVCKFDAMVFFCVFLSTLTLTAIALDRYLFIMRPLKYQLIMTWPRTYLVILGIWLCAIPSTVLLVVFARPRKERFLCDIPNLVSLSNALIYFFTPLVIIFVLNYKIFKVARYQTRKIAANIVADHVESSEQLVTTGNLTRRRIARELKTVKTFAIIVGAFVFCLTPYTVVVVMDRVFCDSCVPSAVFILLGNLALANSILNPLIYGIRLKEYRNAFRQYFVAVCRCFQ